MKLRPKALADFVASLDDPRAIQGLWGTLAFAVYQAVLAAVFQILGLRRDFGLVPVEMLVFVLVATCLFLYSSAATLRLRVQGPSENPEETLRLHSARLRTYLARKFGVCFQGIEHSLSAIMFFARAQLGRKASPQSERDLREVMERIDQVQLLLSEMRHSVENLGSFEAENLSMSMPEEEALPTVKVAEADGEYKKEAAVHSLRKTARKVVILPVTVRYSSQEQRLQFHSYTVNVCEEGACIVFSGDDLSGESEIEVQMPQEFGSRARIRWIQPAKENAFRLAGIEFLDRRMTTANSPLTQLDHRMVTYFHN